MVRIVVWIWVGVFGCGVAEGISKLEGSRSQTPPGSPRRPDAGRRQSGSVARWTLAKVWPDCG